MYSQRIKFFSLFFFIYGENDHQDKKSLNDFDIKGSYTENPEDLNNLTPIYDDDNENKKDKLLCLGTISEIKWNCNQYPLEEVNKVFPDFIVGKTVNLNTLKYIRLFLKENLKIDFEFKLQYNKENPSKVLVTFQEVINQKYTINKIIIKGNKVLTEEDILDHISTIATTLNLLEKIKFLIFNQSSAVVNLENLETNIMFCLKILAEKKLLLDFKCSVTFNKDEKNKTVNVTITIDEGSKYFIRKIFLPDNLKKKIHLRHFKIWINKYGLENGSFNNIKKFFKIYNIFDVSISHNVENNIFIDLYIKPIDTKEGRVVSIIRYNGFESVSLSYLINKLPISIGEIFNEEKMERFVEEQSKILFAKITYKKQQNSNKKLYIYLNMAEIPEDNNNIISTEKNNPILQYRISHRLYENPFLSFVFIPKLKIDILNNKYNPGITGKLKYKQYNRSINIINGDLFMDTGKFNIRSFNIKLFSIKNLNREYFSWYFFPLVLTKYYNPLTIDQDISSHIYKYLIFDIRKLDIFGDGNRRIKLSNYISSYYFFFRNLKIILNPELLFPLTKKIHIQTSLKITGNTKNIDIKNKEIFLHLEMINSRDKATGLLWEDMNYHMDLPNNMEHYFNTKGIIMSNFILNFRFMLNYVLFKVNLPGFGNLQLILFIFYNKVYDFSNKFHRDSMGCGLMGVYNNSCVMLSLGKKFTEKGIVNNKGLDYGLSFDNYSFQNEILTK